MGPRDSLDIFVEEKNSLSLPGIEPQTLQPVVSNEKPIEELTRNI